MAKRLECTLCPQVKGEHTVKVADNSNLTVTHYHYPKFRGKRQLARHLQTHHSTHVALKLASKLLAEARKAVRRNRKEQRDGKR